MDAELARRLGTLERAQLSIILDFLQTGPMDGKGIVNKKLTINADFIDLTSKAIPKKQ